MDSLAELAELAVLAVISLALIVGVIFRPAKAGTSGENRAVLARVGVTRDVLDPAPTGEGSEQLAALAHRSLGATVSGQVSPGTSRSASRPARLVRDDV